MPAVDAAPPEIAEAVLGRMEALSGHRHEHAHERPGTNGEAGDGSQLCADPSTDRATPRRGR